MWRVSTSPSPAAQARASGRTEGIQQHTAHCPLLPPSAGSWGGKPAPSRALAVCLQTWWRTLEKTFRPAVPTPARQGLLLLFSRPPSPLYLSLIFKTPINRENGANDAVRTQPEPCGAGPALESPHETRDTPAPAERCVLLRGSVRGFCGASDTPSLAPRSSTS